MVFPSFKGSTGHFTCVLCLTLYHLIWRFSQWTIPFLSEFLSLYWLFFSDYKHAFLLWMVGLSQSFLSKIKIANYYPTLATSLPLNSLNLCYVGLLFSIYENFSSQGHQCLISFVPRLVSTFLLFVIYLQHGHRLSSSVSQQLCFTPFFNVTFPSSA